MRGFSALLALVTAALAFSACGGGNPRPDLGATGQPPSVSGPVSHQAAAVCDKNPGCDAFSGSSGSCLSGHDIVCVDFLGSNGQTLAQFQAFCEQSSRGRYSTGPCPSANLAGSCKRLAGTPGETVTRFYAAGGMNEGLAQAGCKDHGDCAVFCAP